MQLFTNFFLIYAMINLYIRGEGNSVYAGKLGNIHWKYKTKMAVRFLPDIQNSFETVEATLVRAR
jgi:hypothetical protein